MQAYKYMTIDAFTAEGSLGNPAACVYLEANDRLSDAEMLGIAKAHKGFVSEVVYCAPKSSGAYGLTYYSSECEVDFCGHGTVACMCGLIEETPGLRPQKEITIHTNKKGTLTVYNELETWGALYIAAPQPRYIGTALAISEIAEHLTLEARQISPSLPVDVIDAGLRTLIVPVAELSAAVSVFPDERRLKGFCEQNDIDIVLIFTLETAKPENIAHTRVFAPRFGYLEDPATGSGNSAFGCYMLKNGLWRGAPVTLEQGGEDRVFNSVSLSYKEDRVLFGGGATTRIKGVYYI